jgi:hypothetical protein
MILKLGFGHKTPAMQAGLDDKPLTFRQVFMSEEAGRCFAVLIVLQYRCRFFVHPGMWHELPTIGG